MKILLVGDGDDSRTAIEAILHGVGHEVVSTESVRAAYEQVRDDETIASLYIDWTLPDKEGLELCRRIRDLHRQPYFPVMVIVAPQCWHIIEHALAAGADNYIIKPIDTVHLAAQICIIERVQRLEEKLLVLNQGLERKVRSRTRELADAYQKLQQANRDLVIAYEKLRETNREIADLDRLKTAFIDITAHELRTPLTTILAVMQLLEGRSENGSTSQLLLAAGRRASARLGDKVEKVIQFAYQGRFERSLEMESVDVVELIDDVMSEIDAFVRIRKQVIRTKIADEISLLTLDRKKIMDVMINLLMNAIKFTPDQGEISLTVTRVDDEQVEFCVQDTGIGVREEDQPYIFRSLFTSLRTAEHSSGEFQFGTRGFGLGLSVAHKFVEMHGGEIGLRSSSPSGSCFYFRLPGKEKPLTRQSKMNS